MDSLATKLTALREKKGLRKKQVAEIVGVHPSSIGNLEKGTIPQADLLFSLAKLFDVTMEYLMDSSIDIDIYNKSESESAQFKGIEQTQLSEYIELYQQLDIEDQYEIIEIIKLKLNKVKRDSKPPVKSSTWMTSENKSGTA